MKAVSLLLALLLVLTCMAGCGSLPRAADATQATVGTAALPADTEAPADAAEAEILPDFTVHTVDGTDFTLSKALEDHALVLVNLFATWCPPCAMEFPYLQEAWTQRADQVAVIALSIEPTDTEEVLRSYAAEKGITFPVGREDGTDLSRFVTSGIPATLLIDRTGRIVALEIGAMQSTQQFLDFFDKFAAASYDPANCTYTIIAYDAAGMPVAGVAVNFCTERTCTPVLTGEDGCAIFTGEPARYHVQVISVPDGHRLQDVSDFETGPYAQTFWLYVPEAEG